jgi:hypothetical protein
MKIKWHDKPQKHDYPAAASYLSLSMDQQVAKTAAEELKNAKMTKFAAKDIFRASGLSLLGVSNSHVEKDRCVALRRRIFWNPPMNGADFSQKSGAHSFSSLSPRARGL